jgi:hypothetical protein
VFAGKEVVDLAVTEVSDIYEVADTTRNREIVVGVEAYATLVSDRVDQSEATLPDNQAAFGDAGELGGNGDRVEWLAVGSEAVLGRPIRETQHLPGASVQPRLDHALGRH